MRDPSIHITESMLIKFLKDMDIPSYQDVAIRIVKKAKLYPCNNRKLIVDNEKMKKKVGRVMTSANSDAELFSLLLLHIRRKMKHKGLTQIKQNSRDWLMVKEIVSLANEFCETFNLEKREGYIKFIEIGSSKMTKFMLPKLIAMGSSIIETYQCILEIQDDDKPQLTEKLYDYYDSTIISKTGLSMNYKKNPEKYVYFYRARLLADKLKIDPMIYIKAQFYALEWRNGFPDPIQLVGDKAMNHLNKYLFEKKIPIKTETKRKLDFSKIKELGGGDD